MPPIPITILTGFLGSGKTTLLLNLLPQLLSQNPTYKLALLKNEFGDLAVDSQLASASSIGGVRELLNGCICCNLVGQLDEALKELAASPVFFLGNEGRRLIDFFCIGDGKPRPNRCRDERECIPCYAGYGSKSSLPVFPASTLLPYTVMPSSNNRKSETNGAYTLDGVIHVIDVENWAGYSDTSYTAKIQARYTDLIVFNKWEVAGEQRMEVCLDRVGDLEESIAWVKSDRGRVPVSIILIYFCCFFL
jgi:G3E family GTPase